MQLTTEALNFVTIICFLFECASSFISECRHLKFEQGCLVTKRSNTQEDTFQLYSGLNLPLLLSFKPLPHTVGQPLLHFKIIEFLFCQISPLCYLTLYSGARIPTWGWLCKAWLVLTICFEVLKAIHFYGS